jgi:hypothetical protein
MLTLIATLSLLTIIPIVVVLVLGQSKSVAEESENNPFLAFSLERVFDPDHAIIWDTQIPVLQLAASAGHEGLRVRKLYPYYARYCREYPELYEGSTFESWLDFLQCNQLIKIDGGRVLPQAKGREFLRFRGSAEVLVAEPHGKESTRS